jgi:hypothetical protein
MLALNVFVRVKLEGREELLEAVRVLFDELAKEATFLDAWVHTSVEEPDLIVIYERWKETKESFERELLPKPFYSPISPFSSGSASNARLTGWRRAMRGVPNKK